MNDDLKREMIVCVEKAIISARDSGSLLSMMILFDLDLAPVDKILVDRWSKDQLRLLCTLISDTPAATFIYEEMRNLIDELQEKYGDAEADALREIPELADTGGLATSIVDRFLRLPFRYTFTIALPECTKKIFETIALPYRVSDTVKVAQGGGDLTDNYPLGTTGTARYMRIFPPIPASARTEILRFSSDTLYLQVKVDGYCDRNGTTNTPSEAISLIRAFFGLCVSIGLMQVGYSRRQERRMDVLFHKGEARRWALDGRFRLEDRYAGVIGAVYDGYDEIGKRETLDRTEWALRKLRALQAAFATDSHEDHVLRGAQWLFDSYGGHDPLLRFLQAIITLEILLGDRKHASDLTLTQLLGNRCAYLISRGHKDRAEVMKTFTDLYSLRSKIVHEGYSRFPTGDLTLLRKAQDICRRVIYQEVRHRLLDAQL